MAVIPQPKAAPRSGGNRPRNASGAAKPPKGSNGQGANSALAELLRRQAQNPRPGGVQQPRGEVRGLREPRPNEPRKPRG
jgi:hypothetical protein